MLRLIAGLIRVSSGQIAIDGTEVREPRRDIGIVFQAPTLLPWANILTHSLFPLKILHRLEVDSIAKAHELLRLVSLDGFESKLPS